MQPQDQDEKDAAMVIEEALATSVLLEKYPKSLIDIFITILEVRLGVLSMSVSCVKRHMFVRTLASNVHGVVPCISHMVMR